MNCYVREEKKKKKKEFGLSQIRNQRQGGACYIDKYVLVRVVCKG